MQLNYTEQGGSATYDYSDFTSGLIPQGVITTATNFGNLKANGYEGFSVIDRINPYSLNGILAPGFAPAANITNNGSLSGALMAFSLTDNSTGYGIDSGGKVQKISISGIGSINTGGGFPHTITGTTPVGQDGIMYTYNTTLTTTNTAFFFSYYNTANWNVGAIVSNFGTVDEDFMSTIPINPLDITSSDGDDANQRTKPHPMAIGADGILYIGSGRYLHAYDGNTGATGTFYSKVLTLPVGVEIVAMKNFKNTFLIATNYSVSTSNEPDNAELYVWNYLDLDISDVIALEDPVVNALFIFEGTPMVVTYGSFDRNGRNNLKAISGNTVESIASWGDSSFQPTNRGVIMIGSSIYMNCSGRIITIGSPYKKGMMVNHIATMPSTQTSVSKSGCIFYVDINSSTLTPGYFASVIDNSVNYLQSFYINNGTGAGSCTLPLCVPKFPMGKRGRVKSIEVEYFTPVASTGTFTLRIKTDTVSSTIINALATVTAPLNRRYTRDTSANTLPHFSNFELLCSWGTSTAGDCPKISRLMVEWELVEITN
jgi:hypothetical protein